MIGAGVCVGGGGDVHINNILEALPKVCLYNIIAKELAPDHINQC